MAAAGQAAGLLAAVLLALAGAVAWASGPKGNTPGGVRPGTNLGEAARVLEAHGVNRVFTGYCYAYLLAWKSNDRVIASPAVHGIARYRPWDREVRSSPRPGWVFVPGSVKEQAFTSWLAAQHVVADEFTAGALHVYVPSRRVLPEEAPSDALINAKEGWC